MARCLVLSISVCGLVVWSSNVVWSRYGEGMGEGGVLSIA